MAQMIRYKNACARNDGNARHAFTYRPTRVLALANPVGMANSKLNCRSHRRKLLIPSSGSGGIMVIRWCDRSLWYTTHRHTLGRVHGRDTGVSILSGLGDMYIRKHVAKKPHSIHTHILTHKPTHKPTGYVQAATMPMPEMSYSSVTEHGKNRVLPHGRNPMSVCVVALWLDRIRRWPSTPGTAAHTNHTIATSASVPRGRLDLSLGRHMLRWCVSDIARVCGARVCWTQGGW